MEIHELNTFSGTLGSGDYFATDNGNDTSKVSAEEMFAPLNARIDNIIAGGDAPSAAEIIDARLGGNGISYASLGAAIRGQFNELDSNIADTNNVFNAFELVEKVNAHLETSVGGRLEPSGAWADDSSKKIDKIWVSAGEIIYISSGFERWQFQSIISIPSRDNPNLVGYTHGATDSGFYVVPTGATYIMVSKASSDNTIYVKKLNKLAYIDSNKPYKLTSYDFINGSYATSGGVLIDSWVNTRLRTVKPFVLHRGQAISCSVPSGYKIALGVFTLDLTYVTEITWQTGSFEYTADNESKVLPIISREDNTRIAASEAFDISVSSADDPTNVIKSDNLMRERILDGNYMDLDGRIKPVSSGSTWCYTEFSDVKPNREYYLVMFNAKDKLNLNNYVNYFDANKNWISSEVVRNSIRIVTPAECYFIVVSGSKYDLLWLYLSETLPMFYKRYGQDTTFNVRTRDNRTKWGNTVNWAKMGVNALDNSGDFPRYPHGCKWSFISAAYEGFDAVLIDVIKTSDGQLVVSHDDDLSYFATNDDGTALSRPYNIREHTLAQLKALDMGYNYGEMYRGTRILTLNEALDVLKKLGMTVVIEPEYSLGVSEYREMVRTVAKFGFTDNVIFFSYYKSELAVVADIIPEAGLLIYAGSTTSEADGIIADAISLKTAKNKVIVNAFANTATNVLTEAQIQRMIDNNVYYSASTPTSEPSGFLAFMEDAPLTEYITYFGTQYIPAPKMLLDTLFEA